MPVREPPSGPSPPSPSSPPLPPADAYPSPASAAQPKERRVPSVTPRRFHRFFTPRSLHGSDESRPALGAVSSAGLNRRLQSPALSPTLPSLRSRDASPPHTPDLDSSDPVMPSSPTNHLAARDAEADKRRLARQAGPPAKRHRSAAHGDEPQPPAAEPQDQEHVPSLAERRRATLSQFFRASRRGLPSLRDKPPSQGLRVDAGGAQASTPRGPEPPQPIRRFRSANLGPRLLLREHGFAALDGQHLAATPACDRRAETAAFCSDSSDVHHCAALGAAAEQQQGASIPFSLASAHGAPMTAIGDEQGYVRLFRSSRLGPGGDKLAAAIKVHDNAIMDVDFSRDDGRLATASGDRSGRVVDVATATVAVELGGGHWDSLRQVAFRPGDANGAVLASSDRVGRVQIWDLRCAPQPARLFSSGPRARDRDTALDAWPARSVNTLDGAHERTVQGHTSPASVTAMAWLPAAGRDHLLLTASEADATVKLWDTRYVRPRRQPAETPLAVAPPPPAHAWRAYGITSLALGADAARLYAVCKDSSVYAYSTAHLVLGVAPELQPDRAGHHGRRRPAAAPGLGPLYALRHPLLRVASFYVKCAVRPSPAAARHGSELLAVGSSDACAVVFPTDERYLAAAWARAPPPPPPPPPSSSSSSSSLSSPATPAPSPLPVFGGGTALVRGHAREVTTVAWAAGGAALVTASDDYLVRNWQADDARARHLRTVGEFGGERHMCGWASVDGAWDDDEC